MLNKVKFYLSLILAQMTRLGITVFSKSSGTSLAGMLVLKFYPEFLKDCGKYITEKSVTVSGTNGKTTTSGLIAHIFEENQKTVIHNVKGANMLTGVANVFALNILPFRKFQYSVIESDEAYLNKLYDFMKSDYLVVTNLFRDQLDRYGELTTTAGLIQKAIDKNSDLNLILNADDPLVAKFGWKRKNVAYYGFEGVEYDYEVSESNAPTEVFNCVCGKALRYTKRFFAQQGHYSCDCGYSRPVCKYKAFAKIYRNCSEITISYDGKILNFKTYLVGLYNAYNALAAISLALENGVGEDTIQEALNSYKSIFGRTEKKDILGHETLIQLIKNPTGASEVLKTVDLNSNIIIAINDNYADGRDISWLWDSDFEQLSRVKNKITASGLRANDVALRLKYAGVPSDKIIIDENIENAIKTTAQRIGNGETITILPSYTALLKINKMKF